MVNLGTEVVLFLPDKVVVQPDVSVAIPLQPRLALAVTRGHGAGLDAAEVVGDAGPEVVDVVVLHRHHPVSVALLRKVQLFRSQIRFENEQ